MRSILRIGKRFLAIACALPVVVTPLSSFARLTNAPAANGQVIGQIEEARKIINAGIKDAQNQPLGRIEDAVVDLESGRILYTVAAINGLKDRVALPAELFTVRGTTTKEHVLNVDRAKLDSAPKFGTEQANQLGSIPFASQVYQAFGTATWWDTGQAQGSFNNAHKVSNLLNTTVKDVSNAELGKISNVILDLPAARVPFVVLKRQNEYAIPPNAFTLAPDKHTVVSGLDVKTLSSAPQYAGNPQTLANRATAVAIYRHYGKQPYFGEGLAPTGQGTNTYIYPGK
jgi:sporulation protein YlmC with PRC-barrel domain